MKLTFTFFCILLLGVESANAQHQLQIDKNFKKNHASPGKLPNASSNTAARPGAGSAVRQKCGFASYMEKAKAKGYNENKYEAALKNLIQKRIATGKEAFAGPVTIPVIFHSIYRTGQALSPGTPNLPTAMYQAQLDQLNKDYANLSGSTYGVAADVKIRFCLAVVDTTGKPLTTPGIDRINASARGWTNTNTMIDNDLMNYFDATIKPSSIWDPYSYFNVWTASMDSSYLLGYSTFPSFSTLPGLENTETSLTAGCVIAWQSVGSVANPGLFASYGYGRTLSHEAGHFFGLRHIWGDTDCGEDYCGDTPPQDAETTGCPPNGTLNNCTPSMPKMFQNFMDYTDDACVNTFTTDQALRCQTTMDNSARRLTLIASKACQARAGNAIQFGSAALYTVPETGNAGTCPNSRSFTFNLYISDKATGNATVTFAPVAGSALQNIDYTISPASVSYTANDNAVKKITITIIDDQVVEPTELIQLGYTVSGTGVVASPEKQTISIAIQDDDVAGTTINNTTPNKSILSENFNASLNVPAGWLTSVYDDGSGTYTPNQWVISTFGGVGTTGNAAHISNNTATKLNRYTNTNVSDAYLFTPLLDAAGLKNLNLSFKWRCLGEPGYDEGYVGFIPEGQPVDANNVLYFNVAYSGLPAATAAITENIKLPLAMNNSKFYLVFNWYNDEVTGTNPPFTVDDIVLTGSYYAVAGTTDADTAFSQYSGQTVDYYSQSATAPVTQRLIATVSNPSQDLGCVTASIQNAGTGKTALSTSSGSYFRTNKVIKITPAVANSTVTYQGTLYFSTAELSPTWTALEIPALKILKVKDDVNLTGILTAADATLITPTFTDKSASSGYYSYTGNFTGFSQFMLVSPTAALPVRLLSFDAGANKNSITLRWSTTQELNNKGFKIERSTNGLNFETIGWIAARQGNNFQLNYSLNDNFVQPNIVYYYRIRQVDADNREELSVVRQARISKQGISVTVSPVPAKDVMNVYINGTTQTADIYLINAQGQLVKKWSRINAFNTAYGLKVADLPTGIYTLHVQLPDEKIVKKILIGK